MSLGAKYVLGTYAEGSRVQLGVFVPSVRVNGAYGSAGWVPGPWVRIIGNYAATTGVVVVEREDTSARIEKDGLHPLFEVDVLNSQRKHESKAKP